MNSDHFFQLLGLVTLAALAVHLGRFLIREARKIPASFRTGFNRRKKAEKVPIAPHLRMVMAAHEAGHAVIAHLSGYSLIKAHVARVRDPDKPAGGHLEYTKPVLDTPRNLHAYLQVLLAGNAGERCLLGSASNGSHSDMESAINLANSIVRQHGLGQRMRGLAIYDFDHAPEDLKELAERDAADLLLAARRSVDDKLAASREALRALALALFENTTLDAARMSEILAQNGIGHIPEETLPDLHLLDPAAAEPAGETPFPEITQKLVATDREKISVTGNSAA